MQRLAVSYSLARLEMNLKHQQVYCDKKTALDVATFYYKQVSILQQSLGWYRDHGKVRVLHLRYL